MSVPVWQIPPVDIAKAVEAVRTVQLGRWMLRERALIEGELLKARQDYNRRSDILYDNRKRCERCWLGNGGTTDEVLNTSEGYVGKALDDLWTAQENLKRWEAWFA